jgi:hypothetical protein
LGADTTITTTNSTVTFSNTLDSDDTARALTIIAGSGNIDFDNAVGNTADLGAVTITSVAMLDTDHVFKAASFTQSNGSVLTQFDDAVTLSGAFDFNGQALTLNAALGSGSTVQVSNAGTFITAAAGDITSTGTFTQNGTGLNDLAGNITTTNSNISFATGVTLTGPVALSTGGGASSAGNITFSNTVNGTTAGTENLTLTAGQGNIAFNGAVGTAASNAGRLGAVLINGATNVTVADTMAFNALSIDQVAGSGKDLNANNVRFKAGVTTTNDGAVRINNAGTLTIDNGANFNLDGAFAQVSTAGTGSVSLGGNITSTNDAISFAKAVTLTNNVLMNTDTAGGSITFSETLNSHATVARTLGLTAGTGNVLFTGLVGNTRPACRKF